MSKLVLAMIALTFLGLASCGDDEPTNNKAAETNNGTVATNNGNVPLVDTQTCITYCSVASRACPTQFEADYEDKEDCLLQCAGLAEGSYGDDKGNTAGCRASHAALAYLDRVDSPTCLKAQSASVAPCVGAEVVVPGSGTTVQIVDTTFDGACDGTDPGSDLIYVALSRDDGTVAAYGNLVAENILGEYNEFDFGANLDGYPPSFGGECPEFSDDKVTSLGCGGWVGLQFVNDGNPVTYESGMSVEVYEFGVQCSTGSNSDQFEVFLCGDAAGVKAGDVDSCNKSLGEGTGAMSFLIP